MVYKVLVVDDSSFFCRRVKEILNQDPMLDVIGIARNGEQAITMTAELKPDVVTMDVEMPIMDGITAVKAIMKSHPVPIMMFSSLTHDGAQATLDALDAGALDFLPKKFEDIARNLKESKELLQSRVKALASKRLTAARSPGTTVKTKVFMRSSSLAVLPSAGNGQSERPTGIKQSSGKQYALLVIGTSTGGPVALQKILSQFPSTFPIPIVLVQHMPGSFTKAFSERLNQCCKINVREAKTGDNLQAGSAYLAPGGKQMLIEGTAKKPKITISESTDVDSLLYKPSVDITFTSVAKVFSGQVLGLILTGMGSDGKLGCQALKNKGAKIWAQDEKSSVVYGMPLAVTRAKIAEQNIPLKDIADSILLELQSK